MIHVDESDPIGENESPFPARTVRIARGINPEDKYELIRELGRGKFGTVYRCRERSTGLELAAKFIGIPNRGDRRNVEREVDIMNTLQHHLITQLYDAFEYQKMMCVVLELIEGGELFDRVIGNDFILTERACIVFLRQICEALEFVHRNSILHLDLKPENIMCLTQAGNRIKIIDFGLARKFDPDKKMQILFGTPEFVAPEIVNFDSIGFATDMWSVGVICYVLLSGLSPFMGETDVETMGNVTVAKYDFDDEAFNDVSEEALSFITHLLVKEQDKRMTASDCLQHPWLVRGGQLSARLMNELEEIADLSHPNSSSEEDRTSTLSDLENSDLDFTSPVLPTLPKKKMTSHEDSGFESEMNSAEMESPDRELDRTKDNLKTFVERWDGTHLVRIPRGASPPALTPVVQGSENNDIGSATSDSITPPRNDNELQAKLVSDLPATAQSETELLVSNHEECHEEELSNGNRDAFQETNPSPSLNNPITKNLLEQLDQIEIKPTLSTKPKVLDSLNNSGVGVKDTGLLNVDTLAPSNGSSALSSRGCSPSPCESLTSNVEDDERLSELRPVLSNTNSGGEKAVVSEGMMRDYLKSFDRRKSDSKYMATEKNNPSAVEEKIDLVDEIKRLSDHLKMLNTLKEEMGEEKEHQQEKHEEEGMQENEPKLKPSALPKPVRKSSQGTTKSESTPSSRGKLTDPVSSIPKLQSKIVQSQIMKFSNNSQSTEKTVSGQRTITSSTFTSSQRSSLSSQGSSVRTATRLIESLHKPETPVSQPPWMLKCKRTKFRMTEFSRDVPQNAPDSHKTIFIEEAATNTKDCLLQLLDKYNGKDSPASLSSSSSIASEEDNLMGTGERLASSVVTRSTTTENGHTTTVVKKTMTTTSNGSSKQSVQQTEVMEKIGSTDFAASIPRHFSLSLNWDKDSLEESSMNSLNAFFQRHSSRVGNSTVRQIQQQMEAKCGPQT